MEDVSFPLRPTQSAKSRTSNQSHGVIQQKLLLLQIEALVVRITFPTVPAILSNEWYCMAA